MKTASLVLALGAVLATASASRAVVETAPGAVPLHLWRVQRKADASMPLDLTVAVKQQNTDKLESTLFAVSDPDSPRFGQHLSKEEVDALVAPKPESIARVLGWLASTGDIDVAADVTATDNSDMLTVRTTVGVAEKLLHAEYFVYTHVTMKDLEIVRLGGSSYSVPTEVAPHIDFVGPSLRFPLPQMVRRVDLTDGMGDDEFGGVTPDFLRKLYKVGDTMAQPATGSLQSCAQFLGQYYSPSDLASFFQQEYPAAEGQKPTVNGPNQPSNPGMEATLDIQYIMSMGAKVPTIFWSTAGQQPHNPQNEPFLVWLQNIAKTADADQPKTISASYGDNEGGVNFPYAQRVNTEFQKAGARGISIMFSSGDGGVAGGQPTECTKFIPTFPAGSPYVTAVGGTTGSPETAASLSSGGFSDYWARPKYQDAAVTAYMKSGVQLPDSSRYNHTGAGFPDVSAQAENFVIVYGGGSTGVSGTSCSSPTFSGIVALANDARLAAGKSTLGYLNPLIYKNGDAFQDVTSGNNPGCGTNGFQATTGWDPVTGWGSMDFTKFKNLALSLP